jgi:hypothetical protein
MSGLTLAKLDTPSRELGPTYGVSGTGIDLPPKR